MSERGARIAGLEATAHEGYDGQFAYYMALDPLNARYHMDSPSYRYGRVLYPAIAWVTALGQPGAIPYTLLAINLLAITATVWVLGAFLRRRGLSAWWAAVYGFFPGLMICVATDLTEPLAYFLGTAALLLLLEREPPLLVWAGFVFALAMLARETTAVFVVVGAAWLAFGSREGQRIASGRSVALLLAIAFVPYGAYRLLLDRWLGTGLQEDKVSPTPFGGFADYPLDDRHRLILFVVIVPALIWLALAVWSAFRSGFDVARALLTSSVAVFIVWLPPDVYIGLQSAYRVLVPIVVSAVLLLPQLRFRLRGDVLLVAVCSLTLAWAVIGSWLALL